MSLGYIATSSYLQTKVAITSFWAFENYPLSCEGMNASGAYVLLHISWLIEKYCWTYVVEALYCKYYPNISMKRWISISDFFIGGKYSDRSTRNKSCFPVENIFEKGHVKTLWWLYEMEEKQVWRITCFWWSPQRLWCGCSVSMATLWKSHS